MHERDYVGHDALGLAALIRGRQVSADEVWHVARTRLERINPALNAVITPIPEAGAPGPAYAESGPFAGVPFLVKDLMTRLPGYPMTNGSAALKDYRPDAACSQVRAIQGSGLRILGKTNCSELGASPLTNPLAFGPTANPWRRGLNSGGSSGGSAAAVAARIVPLASASDGGGSIRIPAAYCGLFGLKPGRGTHPHDSLAAWGGAVVSHAVSVSVRDSAAYLDMLAGNPWSGNPHAPAPGSYLAAAESAAPRLRVGLCARSPLAQEDHKDNPAHRVDPACERALLGAAGLLGELGHHVEEVPLPYPGRPVMRSLSTVLLAFTARDVAAMAEWLDQPLRSLAVEPMTRYMVELANGITPERLQAALDYWTIAAKHMAEFHRRYDILLTPATASLPVPHETLEPSAMERLAMRALCAGRLGRHLFGDRMLDMAADLGISRLPFSQIANVTGQPAMTLPLYWTQDGLPVGVQCVAARGREDLLFSLARELETARPWQDRLPELADAAP